jgi:hypothetical protein
VSLTRAFPVTAGEHTFYMTGRGVVLAGTTSIHNANLTGIFVKTQL